MHDNRFITFGPLECGLFFWSEAKAIAPCKTAFCVTCDGKCIKPQSAA
jgi:hypothetical protein